MIDYIESRVSSMTYETTSELAVLYAMKMDETYKRMFFSKMQDKFLKELRFLKDETLYKIVWALVKSNSVSVSATSAGWNAIKEAVSDRADEISPKIMADLLVLSTMESHVDEAESHKDLFAKVEGDLM